MATKFTRCTTASWSVAWKKPTPPAADHHPRLRERQAAEGEVISAGKGKISEEGKVRPLDVKEGDRILFGKYSAPKSD